MSHIRAKYTRQGNLIIKNRQDLKPFLGEWIWFEPLTAKEHKALMEKRKQEEKLNNNKPI